MTQRCVLLIVVDGWGTSANRRAKDDAIRIAKKPTFDSLAKQFQVAEICASGTCVGLRKGQSGNSEVGHLTMGAGRATPQDLVRVDREIASGKLARNPVLIKSLSGTKKRKATVHFLGLLSDGGVHSHIDHLFALLDIAKNQGIERLKVHAFLDGRDTPPKSGTKFITQLLKKLERFRDADIASISGRYYAMDRDNRWKRTKRAYDAIVNAKGPKFRDPIRAVRASYRSGHTDEFVVPMVDRNYEGVSDGDLLIFFNLRADRAVQLAKALSMSKEQFGRKFDRDERNRPRRTKLITMTVYDPKLKDVDSLIPPQKIRDTLGDVLEKKKVCQLRLAETEKYAHVTYFFNGLDQKPGRLEDRKLVPSLRKVGTYDKRPEMKAKEITSFATKAINEKKYGFVLLNFANADMVGHTGKLKPTVKAVEAVDMCLRKIIDAWKRRADGLDVLITGDHGKAEKMWDEKSKVPFTAHTANPVPLMVISKTWKIHPEEESGLSDIAPTILKIMKIEQPRAMTGKAIVVHR